MTTAAVPSRLVTVDYCDEQLTKYRARLARCADPLARAAVLRVIDQFLDMRAAAAQDGAPDA